VVALRRVIRALAPLAEAGAAPAIPRDASKQI
jgi:hypothetical protein